MLHRAGDHRRRAGERGGGPFFGGGTLARSADLKKFLNNSARFAYKNLEPEMVILFFKTLLNNYEIKFNIRNDLDKDVYTEFSKRYTKFII